MVSRDIVTDQNCYFHNSRPMRKLFGKNFSVLLGLLKLEEFDWHLTV
ncbi:MAG: hypothetical protein HKN31_12125 [Pricia sp.]|nr:hypothetical protein [Pricia sp.]